MEINARDTHVCVAHLLSSLTENKFVRLIQSTFSIIIEMVLCINTVCMGKILTTRKLWSVSFEVVQTSIFARGIRMICICISYRFDF